MIIVSKNFIGDLQKVSVIKKFILSIFTNIFTNIPLDETAGLAVNLIFEK